MSLLYGYSGDKLEVYSENSKYLIKKIFSDKQKWHSSFRKQNSFRAINNSVATLSSAPIIGCDLASNNYSFVMPYISGVSGVDLMTTGYIEIAQNLCTLLDMYVSRCLSISIIQPLKSELALEKIAAIKLKAGSRWAPLINEALKKIKSLEDSALLPASECHGDLTFANIISSSSSCFYLIDFSATVYESVLSDIAKLEQDLLFGWSSRFGSAAERADAAVFARYAHPTLAKILKDEFYSAFTIISALNYLRIIPYVSDNITETWLENSLSELLSK